MKRKIVVAVAACLAITCLTGCGNSDRLDEMEKRISTLEDTVLDLQTENGELMSWYEGVQAEAEAKEAAKPDFEKLAETAPDDGTVSVASDGRSMTVDTNPFNLSKYSSIDAVEYIKQVNVALGLPESLYEKMMATRALDGRQTSSYDNVDVSWSYHPDSGLQVIYEAK